MRALVAGGLSRKARLIIAVVSYLAVFERRRCEKRELII